MRKRIRVLTALLLTTGLLSQAISNAIPAAAQTETSTSAEQFVEMLKGRESLPQTVETQLASLPNGETIVVPSGVDASEFVRLLTEATRDRGTFAISTWTVGGDDKRIVAGSASSIEQCGDAQVPQTSRSSTTTCSAVGFLYVDLDPQPDQLVSSASQACSGPLIEQNVYTYMWRWAFSSFVLVGSAQSGLSPAPFVQATYKKNCANQGPALFRGGVQGYAETPTSSGYSTLETEDEFLGCGL